MLNLLWFEATGIPKVQGRTPVAKPPVALVWPAVKSLRLQAEIPAVALVQSLLRSIRVL